MSKKINSSSADLNSAEFSPAESYFNEESFSNNKKSEIKNKGKSADTQSKSNINENKSFLLDFGYVESVGSGIAIAKGLLNVRSGELVFFYPNNVYGLTLTLANERVGIVLCCDESKVSEKDIVSRTGTRMSVGVGYALLGSVVNPLGFQM